MSGAAQSRAAELVALDVDGTLLDEAGCLSVRTRRAVVAVRRTGAEVVLATARPRRATASLRDALGLIGPGIYLNGAVVVDATGDCLHKAALDPETARAVLTHGRRAGVRDFIVEYEAAWEVERRTEESESYSQWSGAPPRAVGRLDNRMVEPVCRLSLHAPERLEALAADLRQAFGPSALSVLTWPAIGWVEVQAADATKGRALAWLARRLGVARDAVVAAGDGLNDVSMLTWAGIGVAVGSGSRAVRAAADVVVEVGDGLAGWLEALANDGQRRMSDGA